MRTGKDLIDAIRPFATEDRARSWLHLIATIVVLAAATTGAAMAPSVIFRAGFAIVSGLTIVRMFALYHDFMHGAILRGSGVARAIFYVYALLALTPPRVWRETHNYHHANTAKLVGSHVGSYAMVSTAMWSRMPLSARLQYRLVRHPLTILFGYVTIFLLGMGIRPFLRSPRKNWDSAVSVVLHAATVFALWRFFGVEMLLFTYLLPLCLATAVGGYLFYAQHNFPGVFVQPRESWSYTEAALHSSSFMQMGPVLRFFTANIGYHHVHHLLAQIPFYRLPEAMAALPELHDPPTTSFAPGEVLACFRLKLWDADLGQMVGYPRQRDQAARSAPRLAS